LCLGKVPPPQYLCTSPKRIKGTEKMLRAVCHGTVQDSTDSTDSTNSTDSDLVFFLVAASVA